MVRPLEVNSFYYASMATQTYTPQSLTAHGALTSQMPRTSYVYYSAKEDSMHAQLSCLHNSCYSRLHPTLQSSHRAHLVGADLLVSAPAVSSRHCSRSSPRRTTTHCCASPERPQRESDQSPAGGPLPASPASKSPLLAVGSVGLAVVAFAASRSLLGRPALDELRLHSIPLESALSNGRPTVLEFYADWCEVCNELAPAALQVDVQLHQGFLHMLLICMTL